MPALFLTLSLVLVLAIVVGMIHTRRRVVEACAAWSMGDLSRRVGPLLPGFREVGRALDRTVQTLQRREEDARLAMTEQVRRSESLAAVGQLAAGVAHELNNPLGGILLYMNLVMETMEASDPRRENLARAAAQAGRAREIVRGLLTYSQQAPAVKSRCDLNRIVDETLRLLERQPDLQNIAIRCEYHPTPLWAEIDSRKIQQVIINIVSNGAHAMPRGGTLTVRTGYSEREGFGRIAVTDTGHGIAPADLERIFEPFFTTKDVGQGMGLGLPVSYGIVREHGGEIDVQSASGAGSTFRVLLPLAQEPRA